MTLAIGGVLSSIAGQIVEKLTSAGSPLQSYTLEEVSFHDSFNDCWIVLFDNVYDITKFISVHPGGEAILLEYAGRDATSPFLSIGHGEEMITVLNEYLVGVLPIHERTYIKPSKDTS